MSTATKPRGTWSRFSIARCFLQEEYNKSVVPTTNRPKLLKPKVDPHLQGAGERVKAASEELERLGIADETGKRVRTDVPQDMRNGADRDFGG
jgi:hypothetical protein